MERRERRQKRELPHREVVLDKSSLFCLLSLLCLLSRLFPPGIKNYYPCIE
jgi:hypothetical protein